MITGITIENFKGISERVEIELRPITLLFGANSAGKSTVLHALHYAREIFERQNLDADQTISGGKYIDLGGFQSFVHNHDLDLVVRLGFKTDMGKGPNDLIGGYYDALEGYLQFPRWTSSTLDCFGIYLEAEARLSVAWSKQHDRPYISEIMIIGNGEELARISSDPDGRRVTLSLNSSHRSLGTLSGFVFHESYEKDGLERVDNLFEDPGRTALAQCLLTFSQLVVTTDDGAFFLSVPLIELLNHKSDLPFELRTTEDWPDDLPFESTDAIRDFSREMIDALSRWIMPPLIRASEFITKLRYLGPLRETPARNHQPPRFPDPTRWSSGLGAWDLLQNGSDKFVETVGSWLGDEDKLNCGYRIERRSYKEIDLADPLMVKLMTGRAFDEADEDARMNLTALPTLSRLVVVAQESELELRPHDVGIGISQVVPVVVTTLDSDHRLLAIEQPELHLHPRLQAELGDLFIEAALGDRKHIVLLETHSEHVILRLLRRIRETTDHELPKDKMPLTPNDVAVFFVEGTPNGVKVHSLRVDETGDFLDQWPEGFFEERAKELF